ncbi:MAG TPA: Uma2 family endonuclease [Pyrinomonadaceae bacterium]|nr:Uma2 family endonuclease [Pyrinomonadaceae bacterium]
MSTSTKPMTAEELLQLPRGRFRYELINGELKTMSPSGHNHGRIVTRLSSPLAQFVWDNELGEVYGAETGFKLTSNPDTVLAPDIAFITKRRVEEVGDTKGFWCGPPELAVAVMSPDDSDVEVKAKVTQWLEFGAKEVWVVNPTSRTVTTYRSELERMTLSEQDELQGGNILPGFRIALSKLFQL